MRGWEGRRIAHFGRGRRGWAWGSSRRWAGARRRRAPRLTTTTPANSQTHLQAANLTPRTTPAATMSAGQMFAAMGGAGVQAGAPLHDPHAAQLFPDAFMLGQPLSMFDASPPLETAAPHGAPCPSQALAKTAELEQYLSNCTLEAHHPVRIKVRLHCVAAARCCW